MTSSIIVLIGTVNPLNYQALILLLIGAVKEQQEIINKMSVRIKHLEGEK